MAKKKPKFSEEDLAAIKRLKRWRKDPVAFVTECFGAIPDRWQAETLMLLSRRPRVAMMACKGPGKSCLMAWAAWWMLSCHPHANGIVCSVTGDNLRDGLWKELALWYAQSDLLKETFRITSERISSREHPDTWWISARSFPKRANKDEQESTLAGLHAKYVFIILDEIGEYPPGVIPAAEGIFANVGVKGGLAKLLVGGNPTTRNGPLYRICKRDAAMWDTVSITGDPDDPMRSPRISIEWAQEQIDTWGRENPWVMANVLGLFPEGGTDELIDIADVMKAQKRDLPALAWQDEPIVWGLDPARSGAGDEIALAKRQGVLCRQIKTWRGMKGPDLASRLSVMLLKAEERNELPDALFVDVGGIGSSVCDHLELLGWGELLIQVDFGSGATEKRFQNKRVEMWWGMAQWVARASSCLPFDAMLQAEMCAPVGEYKVVGKRTVFTLESKKDMKKRGVASPNRADALALTFAEPMRKTGKRDRVSPRQGFAEVEYRPF